MKKLIILFALLGFTLAGQSQILKPVKWSYAAKRTSTTEAVLFLKAVMEDGWHIYSTTQKDGGPAKTSFTFSGSSEYNVVGHVVEPKPHTSFDKNFDMDVSSFEKAVVFQQKVKLKGKKATVKGKLEFMVCNDHQCLPPEEVEFSIPVK